VMDRLVELFKSNDQDVSSWVRVPVVNYLRACPLPKAKEYLAELRKIDPKAVHQSETLYPIGPEPQSASGAAATAPATDAKSAPAASGAATEPAAGSAPASTKSEATPQAATRDTGLKAKSDVPPATVPPATAAKASDILPTLESRSWYIIIPAAIIGAVVLAFVARGPRKKEVSKFE
jgi:hypothetical protein